MTKQQLNDRYWTTVKNTAKSFNLGIGQDCAVHLRGFVQAGISRLERDGFLNNTQKINEAEEHLIAFVGGMAYEAKSKGFVELREVTFFAAKQRFCPLWPFC